MHKFLNLVLALFAAITSYIAFMCYIQTKNYEVYINQLSDRLSQVNVELQGTNEEIRILNNRVDSQTKSLTKLQEDNRIQEVLINEARARRKR